MKHYKFTDTGILKELELLSSYLEEKHYSPETIRVYQNYTGYFLEWVKEKKKESKQIKYQDLLEFINHCKKAGKQTKNINLILTAVRHYYTSLAGEQTNPASGLYLRGETKTVPSKLLTADQLHALYEKHPTYDLRTQRNKVITGLYVYQGISTEELKKLELGHLQLEEGKIQIPATKQTHYKGGRKRRTLPLKANQILDLQHYLIETREKILEELKSGKREKASTRKPRRIDWSAISSQLFMSLNGSEKIKGSIHHLMKDLRKIDKRVKDGVQLRKSVIVNWLKEKDIREVQYLSGHGSISSTERYRTADLEELSEAVQEHHPMG